MFKLITKKIFSNKGAMDRVLVALILVVIGVTSLVVVETWFSEHKNNLLNKSNSAINSFVSNS